jgi:prolipoprotein diacylglyceryl transferase
MIAVVASIPSPSSGALVIGPLSIHAYGLMIALGVIAAVWLTGRRLEASGAGTREDASAMAVWAVTAGVIGARLYHVVTDWSSFQHDLGRIPQIWRGGLGIPGGILFGTLGAMYAFRRRGIPAAVGLSAAAPALPLAQAIGRWGNWWNQELFGKPTTLPWALRIDNDKIPAPYQFGTTFHPTFLYESLWCLALCGALLLIDRRFKLRPGRLFAMYVVGYATGRFWIEGLRIDPAHTAGGLRLNQWVALFVGLAALVYLVVDWIRHRGVVEPEPVEPDSIDSEESESEAAEPDSLDSDSEPAEPEPDDLEPAEAEPVEAEADDLEPVDPDPVDPDPVDAELDEREREDVEPDLPELQD